MRVAELEGETLDLWVARALGYASRDDVPSSLTGEWSDGSGMQNDWSPSHDWAQGGPILAVIIESGEFCVWEYGGVVTVSNRDPECTPNKRLEDGDLDWEGEDVRGEGSTLLVAAMRAYVASKFGEEVNDAPLVRAD